MREIEKIDILNPGYIKKLLGDQLRILNTVFSVQAGRLCDDGKVYNAPAPSLYIQNDVKVLTANTASQHVATVENSRYRRLMLSLKQASSVTSYDFRIRFYNLTGVPAATGGILGSDVAPNTRWKDDAMSSNANFVFDGLIPYGELLHCYLECDNNHATTDITLSSSWLFYDPVR